MLETRTVSPPTSDLTLDLQAFQRACQRFDLADDGAVATAFGLNRLTIWRVRTGRMSPGPRFIGGALRALRGVRFEDIFLIIDYVPGKSKALV